MSESPEPTSMASLFAEGLLADRVTENGVFAILGRLVSKGIFGKKDVEEICSYMQEDIPDSEGEPYEGFRDGTRKRIDARRKALIDMVELKAGPPKERPGDERHAGEADR